MSAQLLALSEALWWGCLWWRHCMGMYMPWPSQRSSSSQKKLRVENFELAQSNFAICIWLTERLTENRIETSLDYLPSFETSFWIMFWRQNIFKTAKCVSEHVLFRTVPLKASAKVNKTSSSNLHDFDSLPHFWHEYDVRRRNLGRDLN